MDVCICVLCVYEEGYLGSIRRILSVIKDRRIVSIYDIV